MLLVLPAWQRCFRPCLRKQPPPVRRLNGAQHIAYTSVVVMGLGSGPTGLTIIKLT
ncbi:hypothetical protein GCM10023185_20420 [Hymenobacter saemangeumensis]|uniref:Uncharacterized protein n=1 Tax=Hymenobacter saemangeumensis TaxID=1084522 RepID=A0ABP8ID63_9BACT